MSRYRSSNTPLDCKVYVGDLSSNATTHELEQVFGYYGPLRNVWVARNPPGFAFAEFEDTRDAEDAVNALDGRTVCGSRVRVELSTGRSRSRFPPPSMRRPYDPNDRCYECGERGHYAYDCNRSGGRRPRRSRSRSRSRSASRGRRHSRSHSASRSPRRDRRDSRRKHSPSRSRSPSPRRGASVSPQREK
ncbi:PREDICTED: serine/arginine-rich splicing factor 7-like [Priapulus caudatus]|uniref:Serine/arginine-rich splicing factor 7-like n=1 Tax=Priapulus caudatus TaxID=37621 RepID=A0ABM1EUR3_PRICU|nr:PREDICTED: serine/arginine-rich splicing factor 7-like [Priapulus caudatus]